jgi:transcriptional regulator GlxA family with amidase domain
MTRRIAVVVFPEFQILDATGPIGALEVASRVSPGAYELDLVSATGGEVASSAGVRIVTRPFDDSGFDTILVSGGVGTRYYADRAPDVAWIRRRAGEVRRIASVCSGAYLLAEAGLLDGKRATTHWGRSNDFARRYPRVRLEPDRIFVREGEIWTSAGITAGIDLTLAMIEDDLGSEVAKSTAQQLVVHQRRPGGHEPAPLRPGLHRRDRRHAGQGRGAVAPGGRPRAGRGRARTHRPGGADRRLPRSGADAQSLSAGLRPAAAGAAARGPSLKPRRA